MVPRETGAKTQKGHLLKFLGCVFGYIITSSAIAGALVNYAPRWTMYVFLALFLLGWVFVVGFATCDRGTLKTQLAQGWEFVSSWVIFMLIIFGGSAFLALVFSN